MSAGLLDTLVKLASLGASGVCVLAIFWVGFLISKLPDTAGKEKHKTMRLYMGMTIVIAIIAFASGIANAWFNAAAIAKVEGEKAAAVTEAESVAAKLETYKSEAQATIERYKLGEARNQSIVKSLARVVGEKELAAREQDASPELKSHIRILKDSIEDLKATVPDGTALPQ